MTTVIASATVEREVHPFTAWNGELPGTLGWSPAPAKHQAASSNTIGTIFPKITEGSLLVTSWGDHRIEQYRLAPHGATFRAT